MITTKSLHIIASELLSILVAKSDGFYDYLNEDYTVEQQVEECNDILHSFHEVINELVERREDVLNYVQSDFNFEEYLR